jgi:hypothetical protein
VLEGNTGPSLRSYTTPLDYSYYYAYNISSFLSDVKVLLKKVYKGSWGNTALPELLNHHLGLLVLLLLLLLLRLGKECSPRVPKPPPGTTSTTTIYHSSDSFRMPK